MGEAQGKYVAFNMRPVPAYLSRRFPFRRFCLVGFLVPALLANLVPRFAPVVFLLFVNMSKGGSSVGVRFVCFGRT